MAFDYEKFRRLKDLMSKSAQFVPMAPDAGGGMPPPDAGGMPPPDAGGMPPPDAAGAPPPDMGGMPPPDAGGMPPPDMAGGMPPPDMLAGMPQTDPGDVSPSGEPYMKITPTQLSKLFKQFAEVFKSVLGISSPAPQGGMVAAQQPATDPALAQKMTELDAKMDAILHG